MAASIIPGLIGAVFDYTTKSVTGGRAKGGSTITQQVAKYLLQDDEYAISRKIREAILAFRLEDTLSKQQILELYLNSIFLGRNAYGVQAASRAYFDKDVADLTLPEAAYLAVLPKAPSNYDPVRATGRALGRRNYVLNEMARNGYITDAQRAAAETTPLGTIRYGSSAKFRDQGGYFMEEVRRDLIKRFGEKADDGPNSVYAGGLWVRSFDGPKDAGRGRRGASRRPGEVRRRPGLARHRPQHRRQRRLADPVARCRSGNRVSRLEKGGGARQVGRRARGSASPTARPDPCPPRPRSQPVRGVGGAAFAALRPGNDHHRQAGWASTATRCARSPKSAAGSLQRKCIRAG